MTQSPEYPDLAFVQPRAYGVGRDGRSVQYVVIHYTAGSERSTSAEDGASYDQKRQDGTSCHYFHDQNSTVQCVLTWNRANSALAKGNRLGIQHELCGTVQTREQWLDPASDGTLWRAAKQVARDCRKYGIPAVWLTPSQVRAAWYGSVKPKGICGHADVTLAYPEDDGDHMDPGAAFPRDVLLERVAGYLEYGDNWNGKDGDMSDFTSGDPNAWAQARRTEAMVNNSTTIVDRPGETNQLAVKLNAIESKIATGGIDPAALAAALVTALSDPTVKTALGAIVRAEVEAAEDS